MSLMIQVDEEKQHEAWEEYFSDAHQRPYWVNSLTEESTWIEPPVLASKYKFSGDVIEVLLTCG